MKFKSKTFVIVYILLVILMVGFVPNVRATTYQVGLKEGEEYIWNCNICDKNKMQQVFGNEWDEDDKGIFEDLRQKTRMRWIIDDIDNRNEIYWEEIEDNETVFTIEYKKWSWSSDEKWGSKDGIEETHQLKDPTKYPDDFVYPQFVPIWIPLPFGEYLKNLDIDCDYTIDSRVLPSISCEIKKDEIEDNYPKQDIKVVALYTDQGLLKSYKLYIKDHQVIVDITLESFITYNFTIISIIIAMLYLAIIVFIYKILRT